MRLLSFFAAALAAASSVTAGIVDCGTNPQFKISELAQIPDTNVKPGDNTTLILKYDVSKEVVGGTATTSMSLNGIPFTPSTENLCTKVACPIKPGSHDGSSWTTFPSGVSGKIVSKVVWADSTGLELLCIKSTFVAGSYETGPVPLFPFGQATLKSSSGSSGSGFSGSHSHSGTGIPSTGSGTNSTSIENKKLRGYVEW